MKKSIIIATISAAIAMSTIGYAYDLDLKSLSDEEIAQLFTDVTQEVVNRNINKSSDDGEPAGTAGIPMLNALLKNNLTNILAITVRYFGGIKLGAGGLVRAYTNAVSNTISNESIIPIKKMLKKRITFDYSYINKINYILKENKITYKEFDTDVIYEFTYEEGNYPKELDNYIK